MKIQELGAQVKTIVANETLSKSKRMIALFELGLAIKEIAEHMGTRYNFVYNVLSNHCNMTDAVMPTTNKGSTKKDKIVTMLAEGKSIKEISIELKINYNYIFNIRKSLECESAKATET